MDLALVSCILGFIVVFYLYLTRNYSYWEKQGIPTLKGIVPGFGHMAPVLLMHKSPTDVFCDFYNENKDASMVGLYNMTTPTLFVREPALIKEVMQTKFSSFQKNSVAIDSKIDPLMSETPFFTTGDKWVKSRKFVSAGFSTMRLKILLECVQQECKNMNNYLDRKLGSSKILEIELKDLFSRFTAEAVASSGFSLNGHSFDDDQRTMSFQKMGKEFLGPSLRFKIAQLLIIVLPSLNKIMRQTFVPKTVDQFFRDIVRDLLPICERESRSKNFFQTMVEFRKAQDPKVDEDRLASDALTFFMDGYENTSTTLAYAGFHIARHPDVQKKLREEIRTVLAKHNGAITYDSIKEMTYMDRVLSEAQRLTPIVGAFLKLCTEDTVLEGSDGLTCKIKAGTPVMAPATPIHVDSRYWTDPEVFDPERFNEERKKNITPFTFMPFGAGPRTCVGMRMGWVMMKAALAAFFMKYSIKLSPKTRVPLKLVPGTFINAVDGGIWVEVERV